MRKETVLIMTTALSDKAVAFLEERHFAVLGTMNKDGSPQLTTMWYLLDKDGTIVMNTQVHLQKVKNILRDRRIAICIQDGSRSVSINGTVELIEEPAVIHDDTNRLIERYKDEEGTRKQYRDIFMQQQRVSLHLRCEKVNEFFA
jgi:PPOX class probable F420-dependent enzyme